MIRTTLLEAALDPVKHAASVEIRRIQMPPECVAGEHVHNCPVVGSILEGSVTFQVKGEPERVLRPGDVFFEPEGVPIARFDAGSDGATFLGYFRLAVGEKPELDGR
jgi:quercetin dioxygenase-like cupin family protein